MCKSQTFSIRKLHCRNVYQKNDDIIQNIKLYEPLANNFKFKRQKKTFRQFYNQYVRNAYNISMNLLSIL